MFKFVCLFAILAVAAAKPSGIEFAQPATIISEPSHVEVREESLAKVGEVVESVPTAVSGYSSSIVHSKANLVTPIIAQGLRTRLAPAIKTYETPILTSEHVVAAPAPILKTVESLPLVNTIQGPLIKTVAPTTIISESQPILKSFESVPLIKTVASAPLIKTIESAPLIKAIDSRSFVRSFEASPKFLGNYESAPLLRFAPEPYYTRSFAEPNLLRTYAESAPALRLSTFEATPQYLRSDFRSAEPSLRFASNPLRLAEFAPVVRSPVIGEANFLKTHAESAPGVSLSTFESKPALLGERLTYGAPLAVQQAW